MYARVVNDTITDTRGQLPDLVELDNGDFILGFPSADADTMRAAGWYDLVETEQPEPGEGQYATFTDELIAGVPTRVWTLADIVPAEPSDLDLLHAKVDALTAKLVEKVVITEKDAGDIAVALPAALVDEARG
jgi:hypothetical protein